MACKQFGKSLGNETRYVFGVIYLTMATIGCIGNVLALWYLKQMSKKNNKQRNNRKKIQRITCSLIVSDSIVCFVCLPLQSVTMFDYNLLLNCVVDGIAAHLTVTTVWSSSLAICFIAYDRFVLLTNYTAYNTIITNRKVVAFIAISWTYANVLPTIKYFYFDMFVPVNAANLIYPVITLSVLYYLLVRSLRRGAHGPSHNVLSLGAENARRRKVVKRCTLLILTYVFCSITVIAFMFMLAVNKKMRLLTTYGVDLFTRFSFLGVTANSCMNPVIYVMRDPQFKIEIRKLFKRYTKIQITTLSNHSEINPVQLNTNIVARSPCIRLSRHINLLYENKPVNTFNGSSNKQIDKTIEIKT